MNNVMKKEHNYIVGVDIQKEYLTVAQYAPDEHAVMLVAIQPITLDGEATATEAAGRELGALKNRFKFSDTEVNCALPGDFAIVKKMPVDPEEKQVHAALSWELGQHIIGSIDDYFMDFEPYGQSAEGLQEFLVVAYRKEQVAQLTSLIKRQKLVPGVIDLDLFAFINVFEANYPEYTEQPAILLHAETDKAKLIVTHHGKYVDHEILEYEEDIDPLTFAERLKTERQRLCSLVALTDAGDTIPVFAAGSIFVREGFLDHAASAAGNVALLHPFRKIDCRVGVDQDQLSAYLAQLSIAVGLTLRGND